LKKTYIIAEIGINHNGCLIKAKRLIDIAAAAGCDAVKFQKRDPDSCVPDHQKDVVKNTPWGDMTYLEYRHKTEFGKKEYDEIDRYCKERKIKWAASAWDLTSLEFLLNYDTPFIKVPSAMLTNKSLLKACILGYVPQGKKIILSTGMSTEREIREAVSLLDENITVRSKASYAILHCNSTYPAPIKELNLSCIKTLKDTFSCEVGYSGHEFRIGTSVAAVYLGASIIERHITLDRSMWGTDHLSSIEPQGFFKLVSGIKELEKAFGDGETKVTETEEIARKKLRG